MSYVYIATFADEYSESRWEFKFAASSLESAIRRAVVGFGEYGLPERALKFEECCPGTLFKYTGIDEYLDENYLLIERIEVL